MIAERAAGNPFFAEEMVRELAQRGVLARRARRLCMSTRMPPTSRAGHGAGGHRRAHRPADRPSQADAERGGGDRSPLRGGAARRAGYRCGARRATRRRADRSGAVHPERRIRVPPPADPRGGLRIAAEIRSRRVAPAPGRGHPRARARLGGRERRADRRTPRSRRRTARPPTTGTCAPATWAANRDLAAARVSWERARRIADALPADDPDQLAMRIAPRTMLCATDWHAQRRPGKPGPFRGAAGVVRRGRRQGLAGHRHERAGHRAPLCRALA